MGVRIRTGSLTAENTFTTGDLFRGPINISVQGTFTATVVLQRSYDGTNYYDVLSQSWTAPVETFYSAPHEDNVYYRIGIKTGGYTSGTASVRLSQ